jgi:hypothetical protein
MNDNNKISLGRVLAIAFVAGVGLTAAGLFALYVWVRLPL